MDRNVLLTVLVVAAVVMAGCASTTGPGTADGSGTDGAATDGGASDGTGGDGTAGDGAGSDRTSGAAATTTVNFWVSDAPIDDFEHLDVTVTKVGFHYVGDPGGDGDDGNATDTPAPNGTATPTPNATTRTPADGTTSQAVVKPVHDGEFAASNHSENGDDGETPEPTETPEDGDESTETPDADEDADEDGEDDAHGDSEEGDEDQADGEENGDGVEENDDEEEGEEGDGEDGDARWIERQVDNRTVDLTELRGDNASLLDSPELPAGKYTKVFVYVSDVEGVLADGSTVTVKLPGNKLHLNKGFLAEPNGSVDFVFDISIHKAGNSGKYILKPVASQSGADRPINPVGGTPGDAGRSDDAGPPEDAGPGEDGSGDGSDGGDGGPPDDAGPPENAGDGGAEEAETTTTTETGAAAES